MSTSNQWDLKESKQILDKCAKSYPAIRSIFVKNKLTSHEGVTYIYSDVGWFSTQLVLVCENKNGKVTFNVLESKDKQSFSLQYVGGDLSSANVITVLDILDKICFDKLVTS